VQPEARFRARFVHVLAYYDPYAAGEGIEPSGRNARHGIRRRFITQLRPPA